MKRSMHWAAIILALLAGCFDFGVPEADAPGFDESIPPPTITQQLRAQVIEEGDAAVFEVEAAGEGLLTYRWYRFSYDPVNPFLLELVDGAHDSSYTIVAVTMADQSAGFICVVTGPGGEAWSKPAALWVMAMCPDEDDEDDD